MKTIVCGPPHSGKSVLVSNLVRLMPSESFQRITANGDGEGFWSNNPNQTDVMSVRVKGSNTPRDFARWTKIIEVAKQDIVLVDVGGRIQDDKCQMFDICDSFIIVSNNAEWTEKWKQFGESHNCKCIAIIDSVHDGSFKDEVLPDKSCFHGSISDLDRGNNILGSKVLQGLAEAIIVESGYEEIKTHKDCIDIFKIGRQLGCSHSWSTKTGIKIQNVYFEYDKARALHEYLKTTYRIEDHHKIVGAKSSWVACVVTASLCSKKVNNIVFYDEWTDKFISPAILKKSLSPNNRNLDVDVVEDDNSIKLSFNTKSIDLNVDAFHKLMLPKIDESKTLLISGRFPNWFYASIIMSYKNPIKYIHVPGDCYVCVESVDISDLGKTIGLEQMKSHNSNISLL